MPNDKGEKQRWLFMRGLVRGQGHWGSFLRLFQEKFPDCEIECLDLPGNGLRNDEKSPLNVHDYMLDLRSHSRFVAQKKPFQVVALSMGAMITVDWMHSFPHEIQKSFLVCTSSAGHSHFYERFHPKNLYVGLPILTADTAEKWEDVVLGMITNNEQQRRNEFPGLVEFTKNHPVRTENVFRQLLAASRYRFPKRPPGDITLIGSFGDRLVSPQCTLKLARDWGLDPRMHENAGHDIPLDDPRWLIEQML